MKGERPGVQVYRDRRMLLDLPDQVVDVRGNVVAVAGPGQIAAEGAQTAPFLEQLDGKALLGDAQGRGHAGYAAPDHQRLLRHAPGQTVQRREQPGFGHGRGHQPFGLFRGQRRLALMHPGDMVADVGQLEKMRVQARSAQGFLVEQFMRLRRARGHDHAVEPFFADGTGDAILRHFRAGEDVGFRVDHAGQGFGVFGDGCHVHDGGYVRAARADEDTDTRRLSRNVDLRQIGTLMEPGPAALCQWRRGRDRRGQCVGHGLGNVLGLQGAAGGEDAVHGGLLRVEGAGADKAVGGQLDAKFFGQFAESGLRLHAGRQHEQIEVFGDHALRVAEIAYRGPFAVRSGEHGVRPGPEEPGALGLDVVIKALVALPRRADVYIEDGRLAALCLGRIEEHDRLLHGVHAADV